MVLTFGLALSVPAAAQPDRVRELLAQSSRADAAGRSREAVRLLERARSAARPTDGRPAIAIAERLPTTLEAVPDDALRRRATEAITALDAFLEAAPTDPRARDAERLRTWARALADDHRVAIDDALRDVGLQDRPQATLLRQLALLAIVHGDLASADAALRGAHRAYPQDNLILSELATVALARGLPDAAVEAYQRLLARQPDDLGTRRDLAGALLCAGRPEGAVTLLSEAALANADHYELWLELALAALTAGDSEMAVRAGTEASQRAAVDDGRAHAALGDALSRIGRREDAIAAYREAIRRAPRDLRAAQGLEALDVTP